MITQAKLKAIINYDPETGMLTRVVTTGGRAKVGDVAGTLNEGYTRININRKLYYAHRLAWLYMTGDWPNGEVDHIDGNRENNRWANLRDVNRGENNQNHKAARADSRSGLIGVIKHGKRFRARITVSGKTVLLGSHDTPQLAFSAYLDAKRRLHSAGTL